MKKESKIWSGFLSNLLGVILGILLTFGVSSLYQKREERQKTKEMFTLLRNELQANKMYFINQERIIKEDSYVYKKILEAKNDWRSIPIDTLAAYRNRTMRLEFHQLTTSAWQIFQNSEIIQKSGEKELIIRLADCYFWIEKINENIETEYWDVKSSAVAPEVDVYEYFDALMGRKETVFFYTTVSSEDFENWNLFLFIDALIDYTVMLLDNHGDYEYDMAEKDEEVETFIQHRMDSVRSANGF